MEAQRHCGSRAEYHGAAMGNSFRFPLIFVSVLILGGWLYGCSSLAPTVISIDDNPPPSNLKGILETISSSQKIRILLIHGIGTGATQYCALVPLIQNLNIALRAGNQDLHSQPFKQCGAVTVPWPKEI